MLKEARSVLEEDVRMTNLTDISNISKPVTNQRELRTLGLAVSQDVSMSTFY